MKDLIQYQMVRVIAINRPESDYDGWAINQRPPAVGDVGCYIELLHAGGAPDMYVVEMAEPKTGSSIWLCEFTRDELESVDPTEGHE